MHTLKFTGDYLHWVNEDGRILQSYAARCAPLKEPTAGSSIASRRAIKSGDYDFVEQNSNAEVTQLVFARAGEESIQVLLRLDPSIPEAGNLIHADKELFNSADDLIAAGFNLRVSYEQSHFMKTTVAQPGRD